MLELRFYSILPIKFDNFGSNIYGKPVCYAYLAVGFKVEAYKVRKLRFAVFNGNLFILSENIDSSAELTPTLFEVGKTACCEASFEC